MKRTALAAALAAAAGHPTCIAAAVAAMAWRLHRLHRGLVRGLPQLLCRQWLRLRLPPQRQVALEVLHRQQRAVRLGRYACAQRL